MPNAVGSARYREQTRRLQRPYLLAGAVRSDLDTVPMRGLAVGFGGWLTAFMWAREPVRIVPM